MADGGSSTRPIPKGLKDLARGLTPGTDPRTIRPHKALRVRRSAFVLVLVRCCLQKKRVNPIRSALLGRALDVEYPGVKTPGLSPVIPSG